MWLQYNSPIIIEQTSAKCPISTFAKGAQNALESSNTSLSISLSPNPSNSYFTLRVKATNQEAIQIRVIDVNGKRLFTAKRMAEQAFKFGESFAPGVYMIEVMQGDDVKIVKGVKVK